jgi:hypothetical protein
MPGSGYWWRNRFVWFTLWGLEIQRQVASSVQPPAGLTIDGSLVGVHAEKSPGGECVSSCL